MSTRISVGICRDGTRLIVWVCEGARAVLKARLDGPPSHPRALRWFLETLALWPGEAVHAVFCVDGWAEECGAPLLQDGFPDCGGPLYTVQWIQRAARPRRRCDDLGDLGDFRDGKQRLLFDALESSR